jgi:uncharacterized membrane protein
MGDDVGEEALDRTDGGAVRGELLALALATVTVAHGALLFIMKR